MRSGVEYVCIVVFASLYAVLLRLPENEIWSKPAGGLVARIEVERKGEKDGTPKLIPYLILKNVTDTLGTVDVYMSTGNLKLWIVDEINNEIPPQSSGMNGKNGFVSNPFWLQIPFDSTIRINATLDGYFSPPPSDLLLETDSGILSLPKAFGKKAYLMGKFEVIGSPHEARSMRFEDKLEIPRILIFDGKRIVANRSRL